MTLADALQEDVALSPSDLQVLDDKLNKFKRAFKSKKIDSHSAAKMEGVGTGALAAASLHKNFELKDVIRSAPWKAGEDVPYAFLAATFDDIAPESKRLAIISMLTAAFRAIIQLTPADLLPAVYLCLSKVCPTWSLSLAVLAHSGSSVLRPC